MAAKRKVGTKGRPAANSAAPLAPVYSYRDSAFYWFGHVEEKFNRGLLQALKPRRFTIARWRALCVLVENSGMTVGDLAAVTVIERTAMSRVIDQMARDRLVERRPSATDRRIVEVHVTPHGRAEFAEIVPVARRVYAKAIEGLDPGAYRSALDVVRQMVANLDRSPFGT